MSKISLKPNASGTGVFSLEAPNSNVDRTLNLPDEAGTVLTNVSDIESQVKTATNATGTAPVYACRAWVNFDGTGTVSIRESGNVSSITDNFTGNYTINFTVAMPDDKYSPLALLRSDGSFNIVSMGIDKNDPYRPTDFAIQCQDNSGNTNLDPSIVSIAVFR